MVKERPMIHWENIDTVLLDMDGTLLDLYFDNYFWLHYLPEQFAIARHISIDTAKSQLMHDFRQHHGTLNWYCLDFWSSALGLDVAALKENVRHMIAPRPYAIEFLQAVKASGRQCVLCTNAHRASLNLKLKETRIDLHLDALISSHDYRMPKEDIRFWDALRADIHFDPARTLLIDDNAAVLNSARQAGIRHLLDIKRPDSQQPEISYDDYIALDDFRDIFPPAVN